jgi:hypothetical protein
MWSTCGEVTSVFPASRPRENDDSRSLRPRSPRPRGTSVHDVPRRPRRTTPRNHAPPRHERPRRDSTPAEDHHAPPRAAAPPLAAPRGTSAPRRTTTPAENHPTQPRAPAARAPHAEPRRPRRTTPRNHAQPRARSLLDALAGVHAAPRCPRRAHLARGRAPAVAPPIPRSGIKVGARARRPKAENAGRAVSHAGASAGTITRGRAGWFSACFGRHGGALAAGARRAGVIVGTR